MALEDNGFFSPGKWGFMEGWPRGSEAPVFDICYGDAHVARLYKDKGEWRAVLRPINQQLTTDLASLLHVLDMVGRRMAAFETQGEEQAVGSRLVLGDAPPPEGVGDGVARVFAAMIGRAVAAAG
jgi:hypothetical protein